MLGYSIHKLKPTGTGAFLKCTQVMRMRKRRSTFLVYYRWRRQRSHQQSSLFSTSGGIGKEADKLIRRMAERMSAKRGETYSSVVSFLRRRFRFDLLETCIIALRGYKKPSSTPAKIETLDMDLRGIATSC